jgi:hypothetical protein
MLHANQPTKELFYCVLRMPKDDAYFVYFTFEANEGMCFYSTIDESLKGQYRDIEVKCPIEWKPHLKALIERLQTEIRLDVLEEKVILDS